MKNISIDEFIISLVLIATVLTFGLWQWAVKRARDGNGSLRWHFDTNQDLLFIVGFVIVLAIVLVILILQFGNTHRA
jgi:hypothetical protein